jgi:hypothetical protein
MLWNPHEIVVLGSCDLLQKLMRSCVILCGSATFGRRLVGEKTGKKIGEKDWRWRAT